MILTAGPMQQCWPHGQHRYPCFAMQYSMPPHLFLTPGMQCRKGNWLCDSSSKVSSAASHWSPSLLANGFLRHTSTLLPHLCGLHLFNTFLPTCLRDCCVRRYDGDSICTTSADMRQKQRSRRRHQSSGSNHDFLASYIASHSH